MMVLLVKLSYDPTQSVYNYSNTICGYMRFGGSFQITRLNGKFSVVHQTHYSVIERRTISVTRFYGNINLDYKFPFLPELRLIVNAGIDKQEGDGKQKLVLCKSRLLEWFTCR